LAQPLKACVCTSSHGVGVGYVQKQISCIPLINMFYIQILPVQILPALKNVRFRLKYA